MKMLIQLEEALMFSMSVYALYFLRVEWWFYLLLFIGPDISMIGYVAGSETGASLYNFFHHKAVAVIIFLVGVSFGIEILQIIGIILFGHSSMDRIFGHGLKYFKGFHYNHLGTSVIEA
ncbi:MAG: DUF4260 domain-containing protein [Chitinophagaceae bacterium]